MPVGPTHKRQYDARDLDPHSRPEDLIYPLYRDRVARRAGFLLGALGDGAIQSYRYVRPLGRGEHLVEHPTDPTTTLRLPSAQGLETYTAGQRVLVAVTQSGPSIIGNPSGGERGLANRDFTTRSAELDALGINAANPDELQPGDSAVAVELSGFGFKQSPLDLLTPVKYNESTLQWETDPLITLGASTWNSATQLTVPFSVASSTPTGYLISVQIERA